jgi:TATA-box binding protein (TBP) (component of TFIID and TFIIIB)
VALKNAEYDPATSTAVTIRLLDPACAGLVWRSGRMSVTGCKSLELAHLACRKFVRLVQLAGFRFAKFSAFSVRNLSAKASFGRPVHLPTLAAMEPLCCQYQPDIFPALIYRFRREDGSATPRKHTALLYVNGAVVYTGFVAMEAINAAHAQLGLKTLEAEAARADTEARNASAHHGTDDTNLQERPLQLSTGRAAASVIQEDQEEPQYDANDDWDLGEDGYGSDAF